MEKLSQILVIGTINIYSLFCGSAISEFANLRVLAQDLLLGCHYLGLTWKIVHFQIHSCDCWEACADLEAEESFFLTAWLSP